MLVVKPMAPPVTISYLSTGNLLHEMLTCAHILMLPTVAIRTYNKSILLTDYKSFEAKE